MPEPTDKPDQQPHKDKPDRPQDRSLRQIIEDAGIKVRTDRKGSRITIRPGSGK